MRFKDKRQNDSSELPPQVKVPEWDWRSERTATLEPSLAAAEQIEAMKAAGNPGPFRVPPDDCDLVVRDLLILLKPSGITKLDGSIDAQACVIENVEVMRVSFKVAKDKFMEAKAGQEQAAREAKGAPRG